MNNTPANAPAALVKSLPRQARPTLLACANGGWIAARTDALVLHHPDTDARQWQALPWIMFRSASWDGQRRLLSLQPIDGDDADVEIELATDDAYTLTTAVRERIEASIAHSVTRELPGGFVQVLIRRAGDQLVSQTIVQGGADLAERYGEQIIATERHAREAVGLPN